MTTSSRLIGFVALAWLCGTSLASSQAAPPTILVCDTLVNLRVLMASGDRSEAESALSAHPGCRSIPRDRIGAAEHRAMVGGAPFECLAITGENACAWVWP